VSWSFDADVLIYAATPGHLLGEAVWRVLERNPGEVFGSVLLPEVVPDAAHLASGVWIGTDSFVTNNRRDFRPDRISEIGVLFPDQLTDA
jgi:hypothetical protein